MVEELNTEDADKKRIKNILYNLNLARGTNSDIPDVMERIRKDGDSLKEQRDQWYDEFVSVVDQLKDHW